LPKELCAWQLVNREPQSKHASNLKCFDRDVDSRALYI